MVNPRFVIKAVLSGQRLNINVPLTVAGTVNYIGVEAKCTSEWDDCTVVCYLYQADTGYTAQLGLIYDAERKLYYFPNAERLTLTAGEWAVWFVGVMAESGQETYRVTSDTRYFSVYPNPFASSIPPGDISLDEEALARATDAQNKANLLLDKYNAGELSGPQGEPGDPAHIGFVQASVDSSTTNPSCEVTVTQSPENTYNMQFAFSGIKGAKGDTGATGPKGDTGAQGAPGRDGTDGADGQTIDDYVLVQAEQPTSATNKMWLKPTPDSDPVMIPTVEEFQDVETDVNTLKRVTTVLIGGRPVSLSFTSTSKKMIDLQGNPVNVTNSGYKISNLVDISDYGALLVTSSSGYNHLVYAFYYESEEYIPNSGLKSGSGTKYIRDERVEVPSGAKYIRIGMIGGGSMRLTGITDTEIVNSASVKWLDKKWVCVGDSLTAVNARTTKHYFDYVSDATGITVVNMGDSGSGYRAEQSGGTAFYQRIVNVPVDADVVTIFGSFNDGLTNLGSADDTGTETVGGCVNATIDALYTVLPTVQLGIVSPTPWVGANPYNHPEANAYADLLEAICKKRSIPFLNLYYESNLRPWDSTFRTLAYSKDDGNGVHPDETGHAIIAPRFEAFLDALLLS